jgi:hypothetical protein
MIYFYAGKTFSRHAHILPQVREKAKDHSTFDAPAMFCYNFPRFKAYNYFTGGITQ